MLSKLQSKQRNQSCLADDALRNAAKQHHKHWFCINRATVFASRASPRSCRPPPGLRRCRRPAATARAPACVCARQGRAAPHMSLPLSLSLYLSISLSLYIYRERDITHTCVCGKTSSETPNQSLESRFCRWIARPRLTEKECVLKATDIKATNRKQLYK